MNCLENLDTKSLILDMTTNLSRIGNFLLKNNYKKAKYFSNELELYLQELDKREISENFRFWIEKTKSVVKDINNPNKDKVLIADDSFTCGVVLQNRAIYLL